MADVTSVQTLIDNERTLVVKLCGVLDTANVAKATFVDVSTLSPQRPDWPAPTAVALWRVDHAISGNLSVNLYWNATADQLALSLSDSGSMCFADFGGLTNNAGAGVNGDVEYETVGFANPSTYSLVLTFKKLYP